MSSIELDDEGHYAGIEEVWTSSRIFPGMVYASFYTQHFKLIPPVIADDHGFCDYNLLLPQ